MVSLVKVVKQSQDSTTEDRSIYTDSEGVYHSHIPTITSYQLACSNGHLTIRRVISRCPATFTDPKECTWTTKGLGGNFEDVSEGELRGGVTIQPPPTPNLFEA
jgi:hypothetical protein